MSESRPQDVSSRIVTVPNILSVVRLLLVPVFLVLLIAGDDVLALIVLAVSSATDFLDGAIARRFGLITRLGQLLDPAADRLFIFATVIGLAVREIVPWWLVVLIVGRDLVLLVTGVVLANIGYGPVPVHHLGKVATFCLFYALPLIMVGQAFPAVAAVTDPIAWAFAIWGVFVYWWAGIIYVRETARLVAKSRRASPSVSDTLES